ncbi:MAG: LysR family transcriptional regulator [Burkholderiales bacterium]|nr:LysR family transcriptional regulator [Burkholderiales bacterium]
MKLRQLEAMRAVVARGTTTHAAEALGLTQSAVSRLIMQLEAELGVSLFERRHGRLLLTPEGQHVYDVAQRVLNGVDQLGATARDVRTLRSGALRIISMPALAFGLLPDTIRRVTRRYAQVKISIDVGGRAELEEGIAKGRFDLGLATLPVGQEAIDIEPLCAIDAVCVLPPGDALAGRAEIAVEDLAGVPFISIDPRTMLRFRTDELFGRAGVRRKLAIEAQSSMMACALVTRGLGVSIVHPFIAATFGDQLVARPFRPALRLEYGLLFPSGQRRSLLSEVFVDWLREDVGGMAVPSSPAAPAPAARAPARAGAAAALQAR